MYYVFNRCSNKKYLLCNKMREVEEVVEILAVNYFNWKD